MMLGPVEIVAAVGLVIACVTDIAWWKIPNWLTFTLAITGFVLHLLLRDPLVALLGFAAATAIHFPLWALNVQKAGDSKLMMGLGAVVGWQWMLEGTLWKLVLLLPVGFAILLAMGNLGNLVAAFNHIKAQAQGQKSEEPPKLTYMPFAPVIAVGFLCAWATTWFEIWNR